ncbi:unnamed protein product [Phytophthora lilii]|uniref:Unnamed protein product n=1 Tax=Phytophthora lilii TaxID=2077276 RepID=A0A9W6XB21_9STRA|nr:unnamed protein product [Phytophthora lilii]
MSRKEETQDQDEDEAKASPAVGLGWCNRFLARHPELSLRPGGLQVGRKNSTASSDASLSLTVGDAVLPGEPVDGVEAEALQTSEAVKQMERSGQDTEAAPAAVEPTKTRKYNRKHMEAAVEMYLAGRPMSEVTQRFPLLHQRTIRRRVLRVQRGEVDRRRGPRPLLEGEPEQELVAWILDKQSQGTRVTKKDILARANEQYRALTGEVGGEDKLKEGWLRRFKERNPVLSGRAPASVRLKGEGDSSTEEEKIPSAGGDDELSNSDEQQQTVPVSGDATKHIPQQKRSDTSFSEAESGAASPKRQKTENHTPVDASTGLSTHSGTSAREGSILPERRQVEKVESVQKLDAILESNARLEEMQRQQLEMLQQLCGSNKVLSCLSSRQSAKNTSTD